MCEIILETAGRHVAKIWLKEKDFLDIAEKYFKHSFLCIFLCMPKFISINTLQATKKVAISVIQSIVTLLIPLPVFSIILYYTNKHDPSRLIYSFALMDASSFIICMTIAFCTCRFLFLKDPNSMRDHYFGSKNVENINDEECESDYLSDDSIRIKKRDSN